MSRETDAAVARALGIDPCLHDNPMRLYDVDKAHCIYCLKEVPKEYSTDWAAAGEIVEKLRRGWNGHVAACIKIEIFDNVCPPDDIYCSISGCDLAEVEASATTVPEAICAAFLKAKGD